MPLCPFKALFFYAHDLVRAQDMSCYRTEKDPLWKLPHLVCQRTQQRFLDRCICISHARREHLQHRPGSVTILSGFLFVFGVIL